MHYNLNIFYYRFVGCASDGAMLNTNFGRHLTKMVTENEAAHPWYSFYWDNAHLLQLAHNDAFEAKENKWVKTASSIITKLHHDVNYGKQYDTFTSIAKDIETRAMAPIGFSTTR